MSRARPVTTGRQAGARAPAPRRGSRGSDAAPARRVRVVAAVVLREGRLLLTQRPPGGAHGGLWEFPGGKMEPGESVDQAVRREVREELGVGARPLEVMAEATHDYPRGPRVEIVFVRCELEGIAFTPSAAVHAVRWVRPAEVDPDQVLEGDRDFLRRLGASG